mgnify:CR=1 FL=1
MNDADPGAAPDEEALRQEAQINQLRVPGQLLALVELLFRKGILSAEDLRRWEGAGDEFAVLLSRSYGENNLERVEALIEVARRLGASDEDLSELMDVRETLAP